MGGTAALERVSASPAWLDQPRELTDDQRDFLNFLVTVIMLVSVEDYGTTGSEAAPYGFAVYCLLLALLRRLDWR